MKVLNRLVLRNFFLNKKRTIVTIIGIILATALITSVANMAESFRGSMIAYEKQKSGDYHYAFYGVKQENRKYFENNRNIEHLGYVAPIGFAILEGSRNPDKPYLFIKAMNEAGMRATGVDLIEGRLPENDHELVIAGHIRSNGGVAYNIGDRISLEVGDRVCNDGSILGQGNPYTYEEEAFRLRQTVEYTIVGIMERPGQGEESTIAPGYTVLTYLSDLSLPAEVDIYATYTKAALKNRIQVTASLLGVSEELYREYSEGRELDAEEYEQIEAIASYCTSNVWLLKWELMMFSDDTKGMLYAASAVAILIIIVSSVFCIRNSFVISLTEKMKLFGMLSSAGATKKQQKRLVHGEALLLGCIGIPLGLLSGILATYVVVQCTSHLMEAGLNIRLVYVFSLPAMLVGLLLSAITVYCSAGQAARKAAKVSPIVAIRGNETVRLQANEVRTPGLLQRLFGIGGAIAYKNLRRARVKYRTTVISIVVSVAVFIAMMTFIQLGFRASTLYYRDVPYQISLHFNSEEDCKDTTWLTELDGVNQYEIQRRAEFHVKIDDLKLDPQYEELSRIQQWETEDVEIFITSIGGSEYAEYCQKLGLSPEAVKDKAILVADYVGQAEGGKRLSGMMYGYQPGDVITGSCVRSDYASSDENIDDIYVEVSIEVARQTDLHPIGFANNTGMGILIVSEEWLEQHREVALFDNPNFYFQCEDAGALEEALESRFEFTSHYLYNAEQEYESTKAIYTVISVFLYGFIIVIALIGITNIFNTITTNLELRSREFAMLKSIGMTRKEFQRMVRLESVFYSLKSLLIGIPLGIGLSLCFYVAFSRGIQVAYQLPLNGILISILAVFLLLFATTRYSMRKISRKNIVETIQNENI